MTTPRTPRSDGRLKPVINRTNSNKPEQLDFDTDDEDAGQTIWEKLWQSAGYRHNEEGDYVKVRGMPQVQARPQVDLSALEGEAKAGESDDDEAPAKEHHSRAGSEEVAMLAEALRVGEDVKALELLQIAEQNGTLAAMVNSRDPKGWTALHWAVEFDHEKLSAKHKGEERCAARMKLVKKLISFQATIDLNVKTGRGNTALVHAIWNGNIKVCQLLLKRKNACDISIANESGWTALHWAVLGRKAQNGEYVALPEIVQLLLKKSQGARLREGTKAGDSLLHMAALRGFASVAEMLIQAGVQVDRQNLHGFTALHVAAQNDHAEVLRVLLEHGARVTEQDALGMTAAHVFALTVTHEMRRGRFAGYDELDDYDRGEMEVAMLEWLETKGLSASILGSMVEPEMVLTLAAPAHLELLRQQPNPLSEETIDLVAHKLNTLALLVHGLPHPSGQGAAPGGVSFHPG